MTPLTDARAHLAKAAEFSASGEENLAAERFTAATSDAVIAGINAKDAICLKLTGKTAKTDNHQTATAELRKAGGVGPTAAVTLGHLSRSRPSPNIKRPRSQSPTPPEPSNRPEPSTTKQDPFGSTTALTKRRESPFRRSLLP
jgi:hypothetical protein